MEKVRCVKCPECLNYIKVTVNAQGDTKGHCKKCNAIIMSRQPSAKERLIRIVKT